MFAYRRSFVIVSKIIRHRLLDDHSSSSPVACRLPKCILKCAIQTSTDEKFTIYEARVLRGIVKFGAYMLQRVAACL